MSNRNTFYEIIVTVGNKFGLWLQQVREEKGFTQSQLASKAKLNRAVINKIENGYSDPELKTLVKIADALEMPIEKVVRIAIDRTATEDDEFVEELLYYSKPLSQDDKQEIIEFTKLKARRKSDRIKKSREKPPAQMLLKGQ